MPRYSENKKTGVDELTGYGILFSVIWFIFIGIVGLVHLATSGAAAYFEKYLFAFVWFGSSFLAPNVLGFDAELSPRNRLWIAKVLAYCAVVSAALAAFAGGSGIGQYVLAFSAIFGPVAACWLVIAGLIRLADSKRGKAKTRAKGQKSA